MRLSFSQIDAYLSCPLKYKFSYLYQIPIRPSGPLRFGTDIHAVLEEFYRSVQDGTTPSLKQLQKIYSKHWSASGYADKWQESEYRKKGARILEEFYRLNRDHMKPPLYVEKEFLLKMDQHGLRGFIDRIDRLPDGTVEVIDYKTGKPKEDVFAAKNIQLRHLCHGCIEVLKLEPSVLSFCYLENNQKVSVVPEIERLSNTRQLILDIIVLDTIEKILSSPFPAKPRRHCKWCRYKDFCPDHR